MLSIFIEYCVLAFNFNCPSVAFLNSSAVANDILSKGYKFLFCDKISILPSHSPTLFIPSKYLNSLLVSVTTTSLILAPAPFINNLLSAKVLGVVIVILLSPLTTF